MQPTYKVTCADTDYIYLFKEVDGGWLHKKIGSEFGWVGPDWDGLGISDLFQNSPGSDITIEVVYETTN